MNIALALLAFTLPAAQVVDQAKIDAAIKKGVGYLRKAKSPGFSYGKIDDSDELILLTLQHAGIPETDAQFQKLLKHCLGRKLERTYSVALQAMIFEELERVKYQGRIAQCAQHLVDNQVETGQWSYGTATIFQPSVPPVRDVATGSRKPSTSGGIIDFSAGAAASAKSKPKVRRKIPIQKRREGTGKGDNSNSQYAALGLRACFDAGIVFESGVLNRARNWWIKSQHPSDPKMRNAVATGTGISAPPRGWCYGRPDVCAKVHNAYGGMTAGATGAMVIYDYMLGKKWKTDPVVASGMAWLAAHFSVTENPGPAEVDFGKGNPKTELYYTLYAIERVGMLYDTEKIGAHDWYAEGARQLLKVQKSDGSWDDGAPRSQTTWDTCFAILYLSKATRVLEDVASTDRR